MSESPHSGNVCVEVIESKFDPTATHSHIYFNVSDKQVIGDLVRMIEEKYQRKARFWRMDWGGGPAEPSEEIIPDKFMDNLGVGPPPDPMPWKCRLGAKIYPTE